METFSVFKNELDFGDPIDYNMERDGVHKINRNRYCKLLDIETVSVGMRVFDHKPTDSSISNGIYCTECRLSIHPRAVAVYTVNRLQSVLTVMTLF